MRRRLALQILATSAFGAAMTTVAQAESNKLKLNNRSTTTDLLSTLSDVHQEASLHLQNALSNELRVVTTDVAFFAQEAYSRAASHLFDTPAFWQNCHDRFEVAKGMLTSGRSGRNMKPQLIQKLEQCLPFLRITLEQALVSQHSAESA